MGVLQAAIPLFFGLLALEFLVARRRHRRVHELRDSITDVGCAILSQLTGIFIGILGLWAYATAARHLSLQHWWDRLGWEAAGPAAWAGVFALVDLGQYLVHRLSHHCSLLWACHLVHHSSNELNYAVALRNSSLQGVFNLIFILPLAFLGIPWQMIGVCYGLNVAWQFWLHTRLVGTLGPLELVLNTPSHHRVHHGTEAEYLNRNFAGVFIIWDRLFGTFAREQVEPHYGITPGLSSANPVWINLYGFQQIARAWRRASGWRDRIGAVLGPPVAWEPGGAPPAPWSSISALVTPALMTYAVIQFGLLVLATIWLLRQGGSISLEGKVAFTVAAALLLTSVAGILEARSWVRKIEISRLAALCAAALLLSPPPGWPAGLLPMYALASLAGFALVARGETFQPIEGRRA